MSWVRKVFVGKGAFMCSGVFSLDSRINCTKVRIFFHVQKKIFLDGGSLLLIMKFAEICYFGRDMENNSFLPEFSLFVPFFSTINSMEAINILYSQQIRLESKSGNYGA